MKEEWAVKGINKYFSIEKDSVHFFSARARKKGLVCEYQQKQTKLKCSGVDNNVDNMQGK